MYRELELEVLDNTNYNGIYKTGSVHKTMGFGLLKILGITYFTKWGKAKFLVEFLDTGAQYELFDPKHAKDWFKPKVATVGFLGRWEKSTKIPEYVVWINMLNRCYVTSNSHYKYYGAAGITVHPDWHCFSTFYKDFKLLDGYNGWLNADEKYHIDKDLKGGKMYSKDTCVLIPARLNIAERNTRVARNNRLNS